MNHPLPTWVSRVRGKLILEGAEGVEHLVRFFAGDPHLVRLHERETENPILVAARVRLIRQNVGRALAWLENRREVVRIVPGVYAVTGEWFSIGQTEDFLYINGRKVI